MKAIAAPLIVAAFWAIPPMVLAQSEAPTISVIEAEREIKFSVNAEGVSLESDQVSSVLAGPFIHAVAQEVSGNLGSSGDALADQDSQISSFSMSGNSFKEASASLGGGELAYVWARADSSVFVSFTVPVDTPYSLSGSFTATGMDNGFCLSQVGVGIAGLDADGQAFLHNQFFHCQSPPEDATFFITGTLKADNTVTLSLDGSVSPEGGGGGLDLLGTGTASFNFVFDLGDRDGDGLLDSWEEEGIDFDGMAPPDIDLPGMGADPDVKDLFVEVDIMQGVDFDEFALIDVEYAFSQAPASMVDNYDGSAGIQLHVIVDGDRPAQQPLQAVPGDGLPVEYYDSKDSFFGSDSDRTHPNWTDIQQAKLKIFRYCLWADTFADPDGIPRTGWAEAMPSNDFVVAAGSIQSWYSAADRSNALAGTFMHEFGHTIGLHHGGGSEDVPRFKPNYLSVMNYSYQTPIDVTTNEGTNFREAWRLDYSRQAFNAVNEMELVETEPLGGPQGRKIFFNSAPAGDPPQPSIVWASAPEVDWNNNTIIESDPYGRDVSRIVSTEPAVLSNLVSYTDWDRLWYHLSGDFNFEDRRPWSFASPVEEGIDIDSIQNILGAEWIDQTALGDLIFEHDFEVGSATAWSETVP